MQLVIEFLAPGFNKIGKITENFLRYFSSFPECNNPLFTPSIPNNISLLGCLRAFIFEQLQKGNIDGLRSNITSQLTEFFPNVTIRKLDLQPDYDRNRLFIELTYILAGTGEKDRVFIKL